MTTSPRTVEEAVELCRAELVSAVICDTLDTLGLMNQSPRGGLRLLDPGSRLCGLARTGLYMPVYHDSPELDVYGEEIALIDSLRPGEVPVLCCHGLTRISPWGELLTTRAQYLRAAGLLTDGAIRDAAIVRVMGFPVVAGGTNPVDTKHRGKLMLRDVPGEIDGVRIVPGDLVFADEDGVVVVPSDRIVETVNGALEKTRAETTVRDELKAGQSLQSTFRKHGIL